MSGAALVGPTSPCGTDSRVFDDFPDLNAVRGYYSFLGHDPLGSGARCLLGLKDKHGRAMTLVQPDPMRGNEPWRLRNARHNLAPQELSCLVEVVERTSHDDCMHSLPPFLL